MDNALASGVVWHRRRRPREHAFRYRLYYSLLDLEQLVDVFKLSRWWSIERFNLVSFRRRDYLGPPDQPLTDAVRDRVEAVAGIRPVGRVRLLTHLRQWGTCFNPVSFYFCEHGGRLAFIVADVHNTPWNERHAYVLDCRQQAGPDYRFCFAKRFHVSPFMPMALDYDWRFRIDDQVIDVHMLVTEAGADCFQSGMRLALAPMSAPAMLKQPLRFPLLTLRVVVAIYWQALRLWMKRIPFFDHPGRDAVNREGPGKS